MSFPYIPSKTMLTFTLFYDADFYLNIDIYFLIHSGKKHNF